ncbi:hypothetical protein V8B97DRAFT_1920961 [Scleroderma yunnanense]
MALVVNIEESWLSGRSDKDRGAEDMKTILHLKNPTRYIVVEPDDDSDDNEDPGTHLDEYRTLINNSDASIMVSAIPCHNRSLQYKSAEDLSDDKTSSGEKTPLINIKAIPVSLASIPEEPASVTPANDDGIV